MARGATAQRDPRRRDPASGIQAGLHAGANHHDIPQFWIAESSAGTRRPSAARAPAGGSTPVARPLPARFGPVRRGPIRPATLDDRRPMRSPRWRPRRSVPARCRPPERRCTGCRPGWRALDLGRADQAGCLDDTGQALLSAPCEPRDRQAVAAPISNPPAISRNTGELGDALDVDDAAGVCPPRASARSGRSRRPASGRWFPRGERGQRVGDRGGRLEVHVGQESLRKWGWTRGAATNQIDYGVPGRLASRGAIPLDALCDVSAVACAHATARVTAESSRPAAILDPLSARLVDALSAPPEEHDLGIWLTPLGARGPRGIGRHRSGRPHRLRQR